MITKARLTHLCLALTLILAAPAIGAAKCESGRTALKACDLREQQPPRWVPGPGKGSIQASVRAACDHQPARHRLDMWLEREGSDRRSFLQVGNTSTWTRIQDIPPAHGRTYTITLQPCIDGIWRVRARARGTGQNEDPFDFTLPGKESTLSHIRCRLQ